jgi:hypothetical protein
MNDDNVGLWVLAWLLLGIAVFVVAAMLKDVVGRRPEWPETPDDDLDAARRRAERKAAGEADEIEKHPYKKRGRK